MAKDRRTITLCEREYPSSLLPENAGAIRSMEAVSNRIKAAARINERIHQFYFSSRYAERRTAAGVCDFTFGNPHEMPLPGLVEAIRCHAIPLNKDWFAYKTSEAAPVHSSPSA
jgi:hypothetical protein